MSDFFLYGTLRDRVLLAIVLGHDPGARAVPAIWPDWRIFWAQGAGFPMPVQTSGAVTPGLILRDVTARERARMHYYEAAFGYRSHGSGATVDGVVQPVQVYLPDQGACATGDPWSLADWQAKRGPLSRETARDVMARFGQLTAQGFRASFPIRRARAAARLAAVTAPVPRALGTDRTREDVRVTRAWQPYSDFYAMEARIMRHRTYAGGWSDNLRRAVFVGTDAVVVLPYDPVGDRVLLVEQFRPGPMVRGDTHPWTIEAVAGNIDPGETPDQAARREAREEAGLTLDRLEQVSRAYASPGASTDYFHSFVGLCDLSGMTPGLHGVPGEGEDIRTLILPFNEFAEFLQSGEANVAPLLQLGFWLQGHRARLRGAG